MVASPDAPKLQDGLRALTADGGCALLRGISRFMGAVLVLSAVGIWLVPVVTGDPGLVMMKLLVSVCLACVGAVLVEAGRSGSSQEVHLDTDAGELRHMRRYCDGRAEVIMSYDFGELADIRMTEGLLTVIANDGAVVVQLPLSAVGNLPQMRQMLDRALAKAA